MKKQGGFSLIELIVAIAIISMVIFIGTDTYLGGLISSKNEFLKAQISGDARVLTEGMINNIKLSTRIEEAYDIYTTGDNELILLLPAIDGNNNFLYEGSQQIFDRIIYTVIGNNLHKIVFSPHPSSRLFSQNNSDKIISENVKSIIFQYDASPPNTGNVSISLILHNLKARPVLEYKVEVKGILRNA